MDRPSPRSIKRLLVANRGEIATRIISSARELGIETFAVYTPDDLSHTFGAAHSIKLTSAASYLDIQELVSISKQYQIDAVHPGYGFLSESAKFAAQMWEAGIMVVGPGWGILDRTGDKLKARLLAEECNVPVLQALRDPTNDIDNLRRFAAEVGYPIMVKAVDGGGGRGIRLIPTEDQLESSARRAIEESPSRLVFAEQAAVNGYLHVEIQIVGDGTGDIQHLWERQCSIQRRYQKVVEIAPCLTPKREFIARIINSAVKMASQVKYFSLGTFEFLANPQTEDFFFLEINPRLQVEHTITESISSLDLVQIQLLLSQGAHLSDVGLRNITRDPKSPPGQYSCQLRITAENIHLKYSLSIGKISSFQFPSGNGIRVDTNLINNYQTVVGSDFDSLLAKLIITAPSWKQVVQKAKRALQDTRITGVKTNLDILCGIVSHPDFASRDCDTQWLEANHENLCELGERITSTSPRSALLDTQDSSTVPSTAAAAAAPLFRKGDAWTITLEDQNSKAAPIDHHMRVNRVLRNEFPALLAAEVVYTTPSTPSGNLYALKLQSTTSSAAATTAQHRKGNPADPRHIIIPFPGSLIEVLVDVGDVIKAGDVVCVIRQMKMELEVRAAKPGTVTWVLELEEGEEVNEGVLAAEIEVEEQLRAEAKL